MEYCDDNKHMFGNLTGAGVIYAVQGFHISITQEYFKFSLTRHPWS